MGRPTIIAATSSRISRPCCAPAIRWANWAAHSVEYGPGKHGVGHSYYVYLLDPDGHRTELLLPAIVYMDGDDKPHVWDVTTSDRTTEAWGLPPRESWFANRSPFTGVTVTHPAGGGAPMSLERLQSVLRPMDTVARFGWR